MKTKNNTYVNARGSWHVTTNKEGYERLTPFGYHKVMNYPNTSVLSQRIFYIR